MLVTCHMWTAPNDAVTHWRLEGVVPADLVLPLDDAERSVQCIHQEAHMLVTCHMRTAPSDVVTHWRLKGVVPAAGWDARRLEAFWGGKWLSDLRECMGRPCAAWVTGLPSTTPPTSLPA